MMPAHNHREAVWGLYCLDVKVKSEFQMAFLTFLTFLHLSWRRGSNLLHRNLWASPTAASPFNLLAAIGSDRHLIWSQNITHHKCIATQQRKEFAFTLMYDNRQGYLVLANKVCPTCGRAENLHSQRRKCSFLKHTLLFFFFYSVIQCGPSVVCHVDLIYNQLQWLKNTPPAPEVEVTKATW